MARAEGGWDRIVGAIKEKLIWEHADLRINLNRCWYKHSQGSNSDPSPSDQLPVMLFPEGRHEKEKER